MMVFPKTWCVLKDNLGQFASRPGLWGLFLFAAVLRIIYLVMMLGQVSAEELMTLAPDTIRYVGLGKELLNWRIMDEAAVMQLGPGYGAVLGTTFILFGVNAFGILLIQIVLSSLGCLLVYRLGAELTESKMVGYLAGIIAATSFTSISLANFILSDSLFFFLFLWGNLAFLLGLKNRKKSYFIFSGICIGLAILIRSIGQFWPLAMVGLIFILPADRFAHWSFRNRLRLLRTAGMAPLIAVALMSVWMARNYHHHSIPMLAFTSAGGPANVARLTLAEVENRDRAEIETEWRRRYSEETGIQELSFPDLYRMYNSVSWQVLAEYPWDMVKIYLGLTWENVNAVNELYRVQLPQDAPAIISLSNWITERSLNYLNFWLSLAGFGLMLVYRRRQGAVFLGTIYLYFVLMMGFTQWQGSRLFYPGQIASAIAVGFILWGGYRAFRQVSTRIFHLFDFGRGLQSVFSGLLKPLDAAGGFLRNIRPDDNRHYFVYFCLITASGLVFLYRDFIFADRLFDSYDLVNSGLGFRAFLANHVAAFGKVPSWNPYIFCGLPYVDAIHGDIFYPLSFLKFFLPVYRAIGWTFILHIFLAGVFAWMAAREMNFSRTIAGLIGTAYMFTPWLNSLVKPGHDSKIYVTALFPLLFFFLLRAFRHRPILNYTMVGVIMGCILLSPHPQMAYFCFWVLAGYAVYNIWGHLPAGHKLRFISMHVGLTAYTVVLAMMLGAIQFLPAYQYTRTYSPRTILQEDFVFSASWSMHAEEAFSLVVPEFSGARIGYPGSTYWGRNGMKDNSEAVGLVITLLAVLGVVYSKRREKYFFAAVAAGSLIYGLGDTTPVFRYLYDYVPLVKMTRAPSMIMFVFSFAVCLLGGMGIESIIRRVRDNVSSGNSFFKITTLVLPPLFLVGWYLFSYAGEETLRLYARIFYSGLLANENNMSAATANLPAIRSGFLAAFVVSTILSVLLRATVKWRLGAAAMVLLPLLIIADDIRFNQRFVQTQDPAREFSETPLIRYLKENAGFYRVYGHGLDELRLQFMYHGISSPIGYHGNEPVWYYRLMHWRLGLVANSRNPRFTALTGVKYIVTPAGYDLKKDHYTEADIGQMVAFDGIAVTENKSCFPRSYLVGQYRIVTDLDSICGLVYDGRDDLRRLVYLDREPDIPIDSLMAPEDTAEIIYYSTDSVLIRAACQSPKILTLSDVFFKDWHVYVDGQEEKALRTYGVFRGVVVDSGEHRVVWKYESSAYQMGKTATLAATGYIIAVLAGGYILSRRKKKPGPDRR